MKKTLLAMTALLALSACSGHYDQAYVQQPQYVQQAAPVVVQQPVVVHDSGAGSMLMGGALGYMLGRSSGGAGDVHHTTVNRTVVNKTVIVQNNRPAPAPVAPKQSFSNYSSTYASRPSAPTRSSFSSSYSSRSSFSSYGRRR